MHTPLYSGTLTAVPKVKMKARRDYPLDKYARGRLRRGIGSHYQQTVSLPDLGMRIFFKGRLIMNDFNLLAKMASEENWCWDLNCTTCGQMHFRYAFFQLSQGCSPYSDDWKVSRARVNLSDELGHIPMFFTQEQKELVLECVFGANLKEINQECRFPDWLGYLGLILTHMRTDAEIFKKVSNNWARQLKGLVPEESIICSRLSEIESGSGGVLNIGDLESCEKVIASQSRGYALDNF